MLALAYIRLRKRQAISLDKTYKEKARKHADFKTIRDLPQFKRLVSE